MSSFFANKTLLLPIDFSEAAISAVGEALATSDETTRICVFHVLLPLHVIAIAPGPGTLVDLGKDDDRIEGAITEIKRQIDDPQQRIEVAVRVGDPGSEIVEYAKEIGADMIMMSSHGRTGIKHLLIGSVAERVVRLAECPVMVLRQPKHV